MADLAFVAELDASKFNREIDKMDARTRQSEQQFGRLDAVMGTVLKTATAFKAVQFASSSLDVWARQHDQARAAIEAHRSEWEGLKADIGSDLIGLVPTGAGGTSWLREARNFVVDTFGNAISGDVFNTSASDAREAQTADAKMQKEIARERRMMTEKNRVQEDLRRDLAQQGEVPEEVERIRHERRVREIRQNQNLDADAKREAQDLEETYHQRSLSRISDKRRKEEQEKLDKKNDRLADIEAQAASAQLESEMIDAKGVEAEIDRYRLKMNERIRDVQKEASLSQEEKNAFIEQFESARETGAAAIQRKFDREQALRQRYTVLELAGVADAATRRQVIGAGQGSAAEETTATAARTATATEKTADISEEMHKTLESIDEAIRSGPGVARYAR